MVRSSPERTTRLGGFQQCRLSCSTARAATSFWLRRLGGGASRFSWPTSTPRRYWLSSPLPRHRPPSDTLNGPAITAAALARIDADVDDLLPS